MLNSSSIKNIKELLVSEKNVVNTLRGSFKGRTAFVVSAGPSAIDWREIYDRISGENPLVVCIKQAVEIEGLGDLCDIHFINSYNLKRYKYKINPLVIFNGATDSPIVFNKYDVKFLVRKEPSASLQTTVAYSGEFYKHELELTGISRPWGPGIMYESVFYTLHHMGVTRIVTIGWDIADERGKNIHYYDQNSLSTVLEASIRRLFDKLLANRLYNYFLYMFGKKYNHAGMLNGEAEIISKSIPNLLRWLEKREIRLEIFSDSVWFNR